MSNASSGPAPSGSAGAPQRRRARRPPKPHRKPEARRFAAARFDLPSDQDGGGKPRPWLPLALVGGLLLGAFWPDLRRAEAPPEPQIYNVAEVLPPPPPPPRPDPAPPKPLPKLRKREPPPPPQFGLQKEALAEKSDLAVAAGNTVMAKADSVAKPAPPPLPVEPVLVDQPPRILSGPAPEYPPRAKDRGLEATVVALITIDTLGRVTDARVERSGGGEFDRCVLKSVFETRFQAPVRNGRRVPSRFRRPYEFRLEG